MTGPSLKVSRSAAETAAEPALLGTLGSAVQSAVAGAGRGDAAVVTFVVTASGVAPPGVGVSRQERAGGRQNLEMVNDSLYPLRLP